MTHTLLEAFSREDQALQVEAPAADAATADSSFGHDVLASVDEIVEIARQGGMFILVDDENRENEGDLVIAADAVTPEVINFMARYGRGLICLPLVPERADQLGLTLQPCRGRSRNGTAFTVSIEARDGVTTGISAKDRATTVQAAANPDCTLHDLVTPGHIFPLIAKAGGVLERPGHTEASVDFMKLAGREPVAVICEIMNDDGTMARLPELMAFARRHQLKIGTIDELIGNTLMKKQGEQNHV
ncbi:3,4-dihydroxy-2-butanone-4-phosphate synthase [Parendozoicomonas haliclonae]|uniref:3,4-dihydroxy-2-butanone 4-phosphate synthase n=1 Tax=Parendozoicomonas haliclonae TaxID=1960125 RepID=A0A1X7ANR5_9GAMM|nr:3,4-dihydroxy-2-butanone-4-phosphate synthase [Parendozoicomonas haliclonae]SMA49944.1 3,4-dihydroxy-2-butanone 4-phosphate synthase [Parendozoicomonas haliclonae]